MKNVFIKIMQKYSLGRSRTSIPGFKVPYDNRYTTRDSCIISTYDLVNFTY